MPGDQGDDYRADADRAGADGAPRASPEDAMAQAQRSAARMYAGDQAVRALGISIEEVAPGRATARMRMTADMVNGHGITHGGYVFLLADTAFAYACNSHGPITVARACEITFLRPARQGDELTATAEERVRMDRTGIYDVSVRRADGSVLAELRGHSRALRSASGPGSPAGGMVPDDGEGKGVMT